jgi:2-oxo-hept-3-ene-1,7-dioate hydratase
LTGVRALDEDAVLDAARRLAEAGRTRTPIRQLSLQYPEMTIEDAYAVQRAWVADKLAGGQKLRGRKIGLTSQVMQQAVSISEPDYGALFDDMFFDDGATVPHGRFIRPRVEVELAFVLGRPLKGPGATVFDVLNATDYVTPAIEILDARVQMSDPETGHLRTIVLRWVAAVLYRNGMIEESGVAAAVLNHPANGVAWLANRLAPHGVGLDAGQVILAGSFTRPVHAEDGDVFLADYGPLGTVGCRFERAPG